MPEINDDKGIKPIAFYLPQYHTIPENDKAWGKGFTEWTNLKKTEPLFPGHNQPRVPLHNNYYNLLCDSVMEWQSNLAQKYGVFGFCYYHYWFKDGKKLLEKPLENMLANKNVSIPFCFSWANENWTKKWDGGNHQIIAEQDYGEKDDWEKHLIYLMNFFRDERYITLDGLPILLIYQPILIPCVQEMLLYWNERIKEFGFKGICFIVQNGSSYFDPQFEMGKFSYQVKFEPFFSNMLNTKTGWYRKKKVYKFLKAVHLFNPIYKTYMAGRKSYSSAVTTRQTVFDYDKLWQAALQKNYDSYLIEGACVDWDNTPRTKTGYRIDGVSTEKFRKYFDKLLNKIENNHEIPIVFINAWNEWGEGAYLEPDEKNGYGYLEGIREVLVKHNANLA